MPSLSILGKGCDCCAPPCGCNRTVTVALTSTATITREGDSYLSRTTSFSHSFDGLPPHEDDGENSVDNDDCAKEWTAFNSCVGGCSNDGRYPDPDAPVYGGEAIFIRRHCEHFPPNDPYIRVQGYVCNTCTQPPPGPCDDSSAFCSSGNLGGDFDYDSLTDGDHTFTEHFDDDFTTDFHYVESRDTTVSISVTT